MRAVDGDARQSARAATQLTRADLRADDAIDAVAADEMPRAAVKAELRILVEAGNAGAIYGGLGRVGHVNVGLARPRSMMVGDIQVLGRSDCDSFQKFVLRNRRLWGHLGSGAEWSKNSTWGKRLS